VTVLRDLLNQRRLEPYSRRVGVWNTFVEGDNLDVLRSMSGRETVDLIYIDPPYNTGSAFAYRDDYRGGEWVAMMRPRLEAARDVLAESGAIFVSIDDNEQARLRMLMDEVFGGANFLAQVVVNLNAKGRQLGKGFATSHEYLLAYAHDVRRCVLDASSAETVDPADFPLEAPDGRRYRHLPLRNTNKKFNPVTARTLHFPVYGDPVTGRVSAWPFEGAVEIEPVFGDGRPAVWRWSAPLIEQRPDDLVCRVIKGRSGERVDVFQRDWLHPTNGGARRKKLRTIWLAEEVGSTDTAVAELKEIVGHVFESPKPTGLIRRILQTMPADAVVLDFFAGSGTTGHAVALQNIADGGTRRCISVNSAESVRPGSNADLAGYATVADITRARLRAVAESLGGGFEAQALAAFAPQPPRFAGRGARSAGDEPFEARRLAPQEPPRGHRTSGAADE
jgi:adenine-specific DNA-methyltransferase